MYRTACRALPEDLNRRFEWTPSEVSCAPGVAAMEEEVIDGGRRRGRRCRRQSCRFGSRKEATGMQARERKQPDKSQFHRRGSDCGRQCFQPINHLREDLKGFLNRFWCGEVYAGPFQRIQWIDRTAGT